jgi:Homeodomain-like domain
MLQHAQRVSGSVSQTCRFFGVSRSLYCIWKKRFESHIGMQYDGWLFPSSR